jgi:hypothetical protein
MATKINRIVVVLAAGLLVSCASTKFTGTWKNEDYTAGPIRSIMVVGVAQNDVNRKIFESTVAQDFEANGVRAVQSANALDGQEITKESVIEAAKKQNLQMVLVTRLLGVEQENVYYPPTMYAVPDPYYYRWDTYYPRMYDYVDAPGYMQTYRYVNLETTIYDVADRQLVWSASSETFDPQNVNEVVQELADKLMKRLKKDSLLES